MECRSGGMNGDYTFVFTFTNNVINGTAMVTSGVGNISGAPVFSANTMTVNLTGVTNAQTITVSAQNVTDQFLQSLPNSSATAVILAGDTNGNNTVNASDVSETKAQSGQMVDNSNFRTDVSVNGAINASDVALVKQHSGEGVSVAVQTPNRSAGKK